MKKWQPVTLKENSPVSINIGDLQLKITMQEKSWIVSHRYKDSGMESSITQIYLRGESDTVYLRPLMPDRPVVVDFKNQVRITIEHRVCFFVPIPLVVGLASEPEGTVLMDFPTVILSNTWFGDHYSGILSYSLKRHPIIKQSEWKPTNYEALCPVQVIMESPDIFSFRRICLYAHYLNIYRKDNVFWNEGVIVECPAESEVKISIAEDKPGESDGYEAVSMSRVSSDKTIIERSMTLLRRYAGF